MALSLAEMRAQAVYLNTAPASRVYLGDTQIWPSNVQFEALGTPTVTSSTGTAITSSHLSAGGVNTIVLACVDIAINHGTGSNNAGYAPLSARPTMTYGGIPMRFFAGRTNAGALASNVKGYLDGGMFLFYLINPPTGLQSITASVTPGYYAATINSVSYTNVTGIGSLSTAIRNSMTQQTVVVPASSDTEMVVSFHTLFHGAGFTPAWLGTHSHTMRYYNTVGTTDKQTALCIADSPGALGNVTMTANTSVPGGSGIYGSSLGVRLTSMPVSPIVRRGTSASATTTFATMPPHSPGDMLVVGCLSTGTLPVLPAGWTNWPGTPTFVNGSNAMRLAYKFATTSSEASGTWTNAFRMLCVSYSGVTGPGNVAWGSTTFPALTLTNHDDTSWAMRFAGTTGSNSGGLVYGEVSGAALNTTFTWVTGYNDSFSCFDSQGFLRADVGASSLGMQSSPLPITVSLELLGR